MPNLECRMYEARLPEVDEAVMIQVRRVTDTGVYVALLEYDNIEAFIPEFELSRRRTRSIATLFRIGHQEPAIVLRVDLDMGYVYLSKRRVSHVDARTCEDRFNKSKLVHSIMYHVADTVDLDLEKLYKRIAWPLYRKYGHAFDAFKLIAADPNAILDTLTFEDEVAKVVPAVTPEVKETLLKDIKSRMISQALKICADVEMKCFQFDGVLHNKEAMRRAEAEDCHEKKLIAASLELSVGPSTSNLKCSTTKSISLDKEGRRKLFYNLCSQEVSKGNTEVGKLSEKACQIISQKLAKEGINWNQKQVKTKWEFAKRLHQFYYLHMVNSKVIVKDDNFWKKVLKKSIHFVEFRKLKDGPPDNLPLLDAMFGNKKALLAAPSPPTPTHPASNVKDMEGPQTPQDANLNPAPKPVSKFAKGLEKSCAESSQTDMQSLQEVIKSLHNELRKVTEDRNTLRKKLSEIEAAHQKAESEQRAEINYLKQKVDEGRLLWEKLNALVDQGKGL